MFYVSALRKAADEIEDPDYLDSYRLANSCRELADEWFEVAKAVGAISLKTWQLIGREIDEIPWVVPAHPALARLHEFRMRNDVT